MKLRLGTKSISVGAKYLTGSRASIDRKSTRLNSSHLVISYAVFCLQKNTRLNSSHLVISYAVFCLKKKNPQHGLMAPDRGDVLLDASVCGPVCSLGTRVSPLTCSE